MRVRLLLMGIADWFHYIADEFRNIDRNVCPWNEGELAGIPMTSKTLKAKKAGSYAKRMRMA